MVRLATRFTIPITNSTKSKYESNVANDSRLARRWKRRSITFEDLNKQNHESKKKMPHTCDLNHFVSADDDSDDEIRGSDLCPSSRETDDQDPQYRMFLEQLKHDGISYALEVIIDNEITLLKYDEADNDTLHESTSETLKDTHLKPKECKYDSSFKRDSESSVIDESYRIFLMNLIVEDDHLVYVDEFSNRIVYEDNDFTNLADSVIPPADSIKKGNCESFIRTNLPGYAAEGEEELCTEAPAQSACSHYRDNLMADLIRPYDAAEYRELMLEASIRRPMGRYRELRGRTKSYSSDLCSKSYLDHHKDFAKKIGLYKNDHPKALNLLRGFFYWLKNLSHEGAFRPWCDDQYFSAELGHKKGVFYMDVEVVNEIN